MASGLLAVLVVLFGWQFILFGWQRADMAALETRLETRFDRLETGQIELRERTARMDERLDRLEAGQTELRERMARIEGTVAGALARPGSLAQAVEEDEAAAN